MTRLDDAQEIIDLAAKLGIRGAARVDRILKYCRRRIDGWVAEVGGVTGIDALEALVARRLQLVFEEIRSDEDFDRLTEAYARGKSEIVFAGMRTKFDDQTFGALVQRRNAKPNDADRFVAVIDCRGKKLARRFFTRWHEIAHRLTTHADMPAFRAERDPIERLMDEIAGHLGFYEPLFKPAFRRASKGKSLLTFGTVETIIRSAFPAASFQATLFACARHIKTPLIYLEAALAHKKGVKRAGPGELRAVTVIPNKAARRARFTIPKNMRVPADSVIHRLFNAKSSDDGRECLSLWETQGIALARRAVVVEGRKVADRVIAIVQPDAAIRARPRQVRTLGARPARSPR